MTFLQHNFDCASFHLLRLRFKKSGPWVCWQCGACHALTPPYQNHSAAQQLFLHTCYAFFAWLNSQKNIYEFMNMYGMRLDHGCHAVNAVTSQRPRNGPRTPKRVSGPTTHEKRFPLFVLCSWFVHLLFTFCSFTVCSRFVLFLFHSL